MSGPWIADLAAHGVPVVAATLELEAQGRTWGPCPSCEAERRGSGDRRGPIGTTADGSGWRCHRCGASGDGATLAALAVTGERQPGPDGWAQVRAWAAGRGLVPAPVGAPLPAVPLRRPAPRVEAPPARPPRSEVRSLWAACVPVTSDAGVSAWLRGRALDPGAVAELDLARALPARVALPAWARTKAATWAASGHRLITPLHGPGDELVAVRARAINGSRPKALAPSDYTVGGLVLADPLARGLLLGAPGAAEQVLQVGLLVVEGEPDFLTWATLAMHGGALEPAPAVVGVVSGAWTSALGDLVPAGADVVVWSHADKDGDRYAEAVNRSVGLRCRVLRRRGDANDLLQASQLALDPRAGSERMPSPTSQRGRRPPAQNEGSTTMANTKKITPEKRQIVIGDDIKAMADEGERALIEAGAPVYQRGGRLVRVRVDETRRAGVVAARIEPLPLAALREELSSAAKWKKKVGGEGLTASAIVPKPVAEALAARGAWAFPVVEAVVDVPIMRSDGTLMTTPGPDPRTGLLYRPTHPFPQVPARPTRAEAETAMRELEDIYAEFPFVEPWHRSAALALPMTLVARPAILGPCPLFACTATTPGIGKTLIFDVASALALGHVVPRQSQGSRKDEEEERKRLLANGLAGRPLVLIDNVTRPFGSSALDAALTGQLYEGRVLGESLVAAVVSPVYAVTGNNLQFAGDTIRRVLPIELATDDERPEQRSGFRHPRLVEHVLGERSRLVAAVLTVLRGYFAAGRPASGLPSFGSFEAWSDLVRSALVWLGRPDPVTGQERMRQTSDPGIEAATCAIEAWHRSLGDRPVTMRDVIETAGTDGDLRSALTALSPQLDGRELAGELQRFRGRNLGGRKLVRLEGRTKNGVVWQVEAVTPKV